jgi:ubiquitin-associated SH3 domain-containing protein
MTRRAVILYATPTGALAQLCAAYFEDAAAAGGTTAQDYPPHCTLTGFFHRTGTRVEEVADEVRNLLSSTGQPPPGSVEVQGPVRRDSWLGLELRSACLRRITADFVDHHHLDRGDDRLRPKDWLHVSLAYGVVDLDPYVDLAGRFDFAGVVDEPWEVGLWERTADGSWRCLTV